MWPSTNICVHWCVKRSQKNIQYCVFLKFSQSYYLGKGLSVNLGLLFHLDLHSFPHCWDCRHLIKMLGSKLRSLPFSQHPSPTKSVFFLYFPSITLLKVFVLVSSLVIPILGSEKYLSLLPFVHTSPNSSWDQLHAIHWAILALMVHKTVVVSVLKSRTKS